MRKTTILMMIAVTLGFSGCKSNSGDKAQLTANEWQLKEMTTTNGKTTSATSTHPHTDRHQHDVRILRV